MEEWTMTFSRIDDVLCPSGLDLSAEADVSRIMFCKQDVQDHFLEQPHRLHDKEIIEGLKPRGMMVERLHTKAKTER